MLAFAGESVDGCHPRGFSENFTSSRSRPVIVGGWPGSGQTTLSRALVLELGIPHLSKNVVKEARMDAMGPSDVEASREFGRMAVFALLGAAKGCAGARLPWRVTP